MKKLFILVLLLALAVPVYAQDEEEAASPATPAGICAEYEAQQPETRAYDAPPSNVLEPGVDYYTIICTEFGPVYIDLYEDVTPETVNNFVSLANDGFYDGLTFHRVMADFMAQGGDPAGNGTGGPGYDFRDEFAPFMSFDRPGLLAMANSGADTNGSQFFITTVVTDWLNYRHTIFGEVLAGQDVVEAIPVTEQQSSTSIDAVIVVTDPSTVDADFEATDSPAREDIVAALDNLPDLTVIVPDEATTGEFETDDFIATLPDDLQDAATTALTENSHEYTVAVNYVNTACELDELPIEALTFELHAFATAADASVAYASEEFQTLLAEGTEAEAITMQGSGLPGFLIEADAACDIDGEQSQVSRRVGRFIMVSGVVYDASSALFTDPSLTPQIIDTLLEQVFEPLFFDAMAQEVRS